ncbi:glycosyltransferase [Acidianus manzaensis]|uniref:LPS biosynthesis protein n=1 Tax=Acidianus manzaensis TaxID=282676 RepID=A0A1W6JX46_9CREN|nr:glycosyltransferase [Acidianus manzaensis]ARM74819.1 LPS biosynthesis protein [Acidianus manzaensis]
MKLGIVYNNFLAPKFAGGGYVHAYEVVTRLKKDFDIIYYPSSPVFNWDKDKLENKAKELEKQGIKIVPEFYTLLEDISKYRVTGIKKFLSSEKIAKEVSEKYKVNVDFLYEPDHTSFDIFYLGKNIKFGLTIHLPLFYANSSRYLRRLIRFYGINLSSGKGFYTRFLYNELYSKPRYSRLLKERKPTFIASVSKGPLEESGLQGEVIVPGNAFDPELLKFRNRGKEDYIVFWSRLNQDKGIHEIPDIVKMIYPKLNRKIKLVVMGRFFDKFNEKRFWKKVRKYNIDVEYLGFVEREKLYETVSKAKLFIYPTHVDGFSLVVLEALALGTPVVAYGIPAIKSIYNNLNAVKIVNEFDKISMAIESTKILSMKEKEIEDLMNEENLLSFLKLHSNWDNVAESVKKIILKYI